MKCSQAVVFGERKVWCHKTATHSLLHAARAEVPLIGAEVPRMVEVTVYWDTPEAAPVWEEE